MRQEVSVNTTVNAKQVRQKGQIQQLRMLGESEKSYTLPGGTNLRWQNAVLRLQTTADFC